MNETILLDLKDSKIYANETLTIDKKISFIFGKNGTGKSTLVSLFKEQVHNEYDVRCFQGFEGVVGEEEKLNAVILGKENNEIDEQINKLESIIRDKEYNIEKIKEEISPSSEKNNKLYKILKKHENAYRKQEKKIENFLVESAKKIKIMNSPRIASINYNKNNFESEIKNANSLTDNEIRRHKEIIETETKKATKISYKSTDFEKLIEVVNSLMMKKVQEKEKIAEISGNSEKTSFAERGLSIHNANEKCSFCGNIISIDRYQKLEKYFLADEVKFLREELNRTMEFITNEIKRLEDVSFVTNCFYSEYTEEALELSKNFNNDKILVIDFLNKLYEACDNKQKEMFEISSKIEIKIPNSVENYINYYNKLVVKNNSGDIEVKQKESENALRYNEIKKLLEEFDYENEKYILSELKIEFEKDRAIINSKNEKIEEINKEITKIKQEIINLQAKTKNEKILAEKINKKLKLYVNFNLEYLEDSSDEGFYMVRCKNTNDLRNVTQLSSGEKNIIAFLYFINKLNEINDKKLLPKLVIFDDPMTSNDDKMQYLIIEELCSLINNLKDDEKIIIMTHNNHFYLNIKYKYSDYKKNIFLRLNSDGHKTHIIKLKDSAEYFRTNYEALWMELIFIYENSPYEDMILNPIRRIIETFTKFNCINKSYMLEHVTGAEKLINVNSHSIDDSTAELFVGTKKDAMKIMRDCFDGVNALNHFNKYWNINLD